MSREPSVQTSLTLLHRIEGHDQEAWSLFTRLYGPLVYSWCRNMGLQPDDVDDVGQEVFRVVSLKLGTFEPGKKSFGAFRSWLWGITRLETLNHLRSVRRQPIGLGGTDHYIILQRVEDESKEPDSIAGLTPQQLLLQSAFDVLKSEFDPRTWQAFWDMAVKGRPARDIGEELDMTAKAVRQAKFRVTKKLRELLDDDFMGLAVVESQCRDASATTSPHWIDQ
ncbi:MAG TPA: sigma-70 family RNA polymerase sigma factor [Pirellulaceae bacterium]|nr:sigma-70 family RNA polymerase sigma factor [Pirellulaceae bacterium]